MADRPMPSERGETEQLDQDEARQGYTLNVQRYVLLVSLVLLVIAFTLAYILSV